MLCIVITGRICRRQLCRYFVYSRADFGVFRPAGATRCTDQGQVWRRSAPPCQIWPWSVQGWGFKAPKLKKNSNFPNIIAPKGRVPCTIFTKFTGYMRVLSLYNIAEFGCFASINDKIMNKMMARTSSITMQNLVEIARRTSELEDEMWCFSLFLFNFL